MTSPMSLRTSVCATALAAVTLGALATPATAGRDPDWVVQFGTEEIDQAAGMAIDAAGNIYLTGWTCGSLGGTNAGENDAWVAKYDAIGQRLWIRQLGTSRIDTGSDVAIDAAGNFFVIGSTQGSLGRIRKPEEQEFDPWVAKYDSAGTLLWVRQPSTTRLDEGLGIATDTAGNVYLTGYIESATGRYPLGDGDAWVSRYDGGGRKLWSRQFGTADTDNAIDIATDADANIYLTGTTHSNGSGELIWDAWVVKYGNAGRKLWTRRLGTAELDWANGIATDTAGNVYLTGYTEGAMGRYPQGSSDAWLAKYDGDGRKQWVRQFGTSASDRGHAIATDAAGNVYLTGYTLGSLGGANRGGLDAWIAQYAADGRKTCEWQFGTEAEEFATGIAIGVATDAASNIYVTGTTSGSLGGANLGGKDVFLAKFSPGCR